MNKRLRLLSVLLILVLLGGGLVAGQSTKQLAQKYRNANPGESFTVGCITWWLGQEYAIMVYQAVEQAAKQMGLKFRGAVASTESDWIELTESMIAAGAKAIVYNVPNMAVMKQVAEIANQNKVFIATYFGYTGDIMPGDYGPYWVIDNTPFSDEQTYIPLTLLMQKMKNAGKNKVLIHQASKSAATVSTVYINLGIYQALQKFPEMKLSGFQYGEWGFEPGRAAAEASLAVSKDYQGMWGANDGQTMGALKALKDQGSEHRRLLRVPGHGADHRPGDHEGQLPVRRPDSPSPTSAAGSSRCSMTCAWAIGIPPRTRCCRPAPWTSTVDPASWKRWPSRPASTTTPASTRVPSRRTWSRSWRR